MNAMVQLFFWAVFHEFLARVVSIGHLACTVRYSGLFALFT